ncbi:MAG: alpha/beta fold hydrolase [Proteobacteria bacterium]|nr:alpha/beta fold hydrolase [Pseudomonadota bacterium]
MSEPVVDPSPFDLGSGEAGAVLCLHGLTGTPYEVRPLGEALAARGLRAFGPMLPGHESAQVLSKLPYTAWLDAVREHFDALQAEHAPVSVVGLSLGGLLTLALAAEAKPAAVAVIGTPLRFPGWMNTLIPVAKLVRPLLPKAGGSDIQEAAARRRHPGLPVMPLTSVHELMRLQKIVQARLGEIRCPLLAAHGAHDRTARKSCLDAILSGVASTRKRRLWLENSGHVVPVDYDGPRLAAEVADFLAAETGR